METLYVWHALQKQPQQYFMHHFGTCMYKVCKWSFRPSHWQRITANSNVYFSKIQPLIQSFSGNESNRSLWVEEIAFPELHFTAWCWIHSSGNSFWMFHHRLDPRVWYNPLITHTRTHPPTMRSFRIMHVGNMRVNHLLGERFDCIFNVGGYKHDRMSSQAVTVTLVCQNSFEGVTLSLGSKCYFHVVMWTFMIQYLTVLTPIFQLTSGLMVSHYHIEISRTLLTKTQVYLLSGQIFHFNRIMPSTNVSSAKMAYCQTVIGCIQAQKQ